MGPAMPAVLVGLGSRNITYQRTPGGISGGNSGCSSGVGSTRGSGSDMGGSIRGGKG